VHTEKLRGFRDYKEIKYKVCKRNKLRYKGIIKRVNTKCLREIYIEKK